MCLGCGERAAEAQTCADAFHILLAWEWDYAMQDVHHLLVLCYHLQHPNLYSLEGLNGAKAMLIAFVEDGMTPGAMRQHIGQQVASDARTFSITAKNKVGGVYDKPVVWEIRVWDCVRAGPEEYYASVRTWAAHILAALRASGNLDGVSPQQVLR